MISYVMTSLTLLSNLDLSGNYIQDDGVLALSEALKSNSTLTVLSLGSD